MRLVFRAALLGLFFASASAAHSEDKAVIEVNDSLKDTESRIAGILKERLKIVSSLKVKGGNAEDLVLQINLGPIKEKGLPLRVFVIDTKIIARGKDGMATAQVIGIDSFSDVRPAADKVDGLLEWANKWNTQTLPFRIYVGGERIVAGQNLLITKQAPLSENQLLSAFTTIVNFWPVLLRDLRTNGIIE